MDERPNLQEAVGRLALGALREALGGVDSYVVGGTVRDLLEGGVSGPDIDIAVDGDLEALLTGLDRSPAIQIEATHSRFGAARILVEGRPVDLTRTRAETYSSPGALPEVSPAPIHRDLARRDFSVNAMAVPLASPGQLLDPFDGQLDLRERRLRVLHDASFTDDPTRAIRAARYAPRLGLVPDDTTLRLLRKADLTTVSADRREGELGRLAAEPTAPDGFALLAEWGLLELPADSLELVRAIDRLASEQPWIVLPEARGEAILLATGDAARTDAAMKLARTEPERPSEAVRVARGHLPAELLVAAAAGAGWVDDYMSRWSSTALEIDGADLIAAGIPEGPAVGEGLRGALERKLDGGLRGGRDAELELAVALARRSI